MLHMSEWKPAKFHCTRAIDDANGRMSDHPGKVDLIQTPHVSYNILPRAESR